MKNLGEIIKEDDAEGEVAVNSQAKGPNSDDTLERAMDTDEATSRLGN